MAAGARKGQPSRKLVPLADQEALRQRIRLFMVEQGVTIGDLAEAGGYGRDAQRHLSWFVAGAAGIKLGRYETMTAALDRFPTGWVLRAKPYENANAKARERAPSSSSAGEDIRQAALERTEALRHSVSPDGVPSPLNRAAWEAYWLAREQPGLDGRKHRTTPLSQQVA